MSTVPIDSSQGDVIKARIEGEISGQVAVGKYITQIGSVHGTLVLVNRPEDIPKPQRRPSPVYILPRPFPGFLNRNSEVNNTVAALRSGNPVEYVGRGGIGKTSLLRQLARQVLTDAFPGGVVYINARNNPLDDLFHEIYSAFYESAIPVKPTDTEVQHALATVQALILVDDSGVSREQMDFLLDAAPSCMFVLATEERKMWGLGRSSQIAGLPLDDASQLFERELGRELDAAEREVTAEIVAFLEGHPLGIVQAAALAMSEGFSLDQVLERVRQGPPDEQVVEELVDSRPERERRSLAMLAAFGKTAVGSNQFAALTGVADATALLDGLHAAGLANVEAGQVSIASNAAPQMPAAEVSRQMERAVDHFANLAANNASEPQQLLADLDALQHVHRWAIEHGRWDQAIDMGGPVGNALALSGRWRSWEAVLDRTLEAARISGNRSAEGWALNELGVRALGLGHDDVARTSLESSLRIRESIGESLGADITRHNLSHLIVPPAISQREDGGDGQTRPDGGDSIFRTIFTSVMLVGGLAALVYVAISVGGIKLDDVFGGDNGDVIAGPEVSPVPSPTPQETIATSVPSPITKPTPTVAPDPTVTPTPSPTPEPTPPPGAAPVITLHPESIEVHDGDVASFYAEAIRDPVPTVQWQISQDSGRSWRDLPGETMAVLAFVADLRHDESLIRAVFRNPAGSTISNQATLSVLPLPPETPTSVEVSLSDVGVVVSWESDDEQVDGFIISRIAGGEWDEDYAGVLAPETEFVDRDVRLPDDDSDDDDQRPPYWELGYRVAAYNKGGTSEFSGTVYVVTLN